MLVISVGTLLAYFIMLADGSNAFYSFMCFSRSKILHGQIWRLITFIFVPYNTGLWLFLLLFAYYGIGRMVERAWGTLKFNLFYLCGIIIMDVAALILNATPSSYYLNMSLFLALATLYPDNRVMLMYIIPLKMKYLAWVYLLLALADLVQLDLFPVFALLNYFLFFGWDCINELPESWQDRIRASHIYGGSRSSYSYDSTGSHRSSRTSRSSRSENRPIPNWAKGYKKSGNSGAGHRVVDEPEYRHKCAVCGRTDVSNPELEFRYCSKCKGYYCYCQDHINNHAHIQ